MPTEFDDSLELDEQWTYVGSKENEQWIWIAVSFKTSQVVSFSVGDRSEQTARKMYDKIPRSYGLKQKYTDGYIVYENLLPVSFHLQCDKRSGCTSVVEGVNTAIRHRVSYQVRRSASFARSFDWLVKRLRYFFHYYNLWIAQRRQKEKLQAK